MKFYVLNGPNINMLGIREPDIYGRLDYKGLLAYIAAGAKELGVEVDFYQSNSEGDLVSAIQQALGRYDGIVINPAAYTHTSVAILDALKAVDLPAAEVHISDVTKREAFRQVSYAGMACKYHFVGEGKEGYVHALERLAGEVSGALRILHALPAAAWREASAAGELMPAPGQAYIHCSPIEYFHRVDAARFAGRPHVLLAIDPARVEAPVRWENGAPAPDAPRYYPHVYGPVPAAAITDAVPLRFDAAGRWLRDPRLPALADR